MAGIWFHEAPVRLELVVDEIVGVHVAEQHDVAAVAPVAAVGPAPRLVFFPAKGNAAASAVAREEFHCAFVNKHSTTMQMAARLPRGVPSRACERHRLFTKENAWR